MADSNDLLNGDEDNGAEVDDRFNNGQSSGQQPSDSSPEQVHTLLTVNTGSAELKSAEATSTPKSVQPVKTTTG